MWITGLAASVLLGAFLVAGCSDAANKKHDSIDKDSVEVTGQENDGFYRDCYENFFKDLPKFKDSGTALLILRNGNKATLTQFFKDEFMSPMSQYGRKDLDADGIPELIIYNNTGGAHCCDEYYVFRQNQKQYFEFKASLVSGQVCADSSSNVFTYSFTEALGYFFGCYACGYEDSSGAFKSMREIRLRFNNRKFEVMVYNKSDEQQNLTNLEILRASGYQEIQGMMDNGWRKEFAMNFAVWHYNHGQDWKKTKKLFDKYYHFEDAVKVWTEFHNTLKDIKQQNSF